MEPVATAWRALSYWSVLHFIASNLLQMVSNAWTLIPAAVVLLQQGIGIAALAGIALLTLVLVGAVLQHRFFRYQLQDGRLHVRQGVLQKKQLSLDYQRIQNVSIESPIYFRPLGLVTVKVEGAGSAGEEVSLAALNADAGAELRERILASRAQASASADQAEQQIEDEGEALLNTRSVRDLVVNGLTSNRIWVILGAAAALYGQAINSFQDYFEELELGDAISAQLADQSLLAIVLFGAALVVIILLAIAGLSVLGSLLLYWNFHLYATSEGYKSRHGLLTVREMHVKHSRVQAIVVRQNWLARLIGRLDFVYEQLSHDAGSSGRRSNRLTVPSLFADDATKLVQHYDDTLAFPESLQFQPSHINYWLRQVLLFGVLYGGFGIAFWFNDLAWLTGAFAGLWVVHCGLAYVRFRRLGIARHNDYVVLRKGLFGVTYVSLPMFKLQRVSMQQSFLMARRDLANITFYSAATSATGYYLPHADVRELLNIALYEVESSRRSWM